MFTNRYDTKATDYAKQQIEGTLLLAYREFNRILNQYATEGREALDFGCGSGRSTRFLQHLGFRTMGVDVDPSMLLEAAKEDRNGNYQLIEKDRIPDRDAKYDIAFSAFVLLEMPSLEVMHQALQEMYRALKQNGTMVILSVNDDFYSHDWISIDTNYPQNNQPKSGDQVKVRLKEVNLELVDYYWTKKDYLNVFNQAGFSVVEELHPLANGVEDGKFSWKDETNFSPYVIYVLKKQTALQNMDELAKRMGLSCIPGKGYFKEIKPSNNFYSQRKQFSEGQLLMCPGQRWQFHKLKSKETFYYLDGKDLLIHTIDANGNYQKIFLGKENDLAQREVVIPAETWFAEEVCGELGYSLFKIKNEPAFQPNDVTIASQSHLLSLVGYNEEAASVIQHLTDPDLSYSLGKNS